MKSSHFYSSSSSGDTLEHVNFTQTTSTQIPSTFHLNTIQSTAALKIQSAYRSHTIRKLTNKIKSVNNEADKLQRLIQLQETVDTVRTDNRERIKINEALMNLLFTLDSILGFDPTVRELRRNVSRRIVGLQEILDSICETNLGNWDAFLRDWDDVIAGIEHEVCREQGGDDLCEIDRFCAENLGFQCLQRFLRQ
ncbi:hypothetical protein QVD17_20441 [Tagetes erecta]|uniref:BAG domain-containing protein n=1 Tax=Tagetes erecta TaxID=13708 RepID=A0AAD8KRN0_TARER|nr:hypothetical protein QVD17_20441 [Tagetes erecta]